METINRSQLILRQKIFLKKLLAYGDEYDWIQDNYVVLVPDLQDKSQCIAYLKANKRYKKVFDQFLSLQFYGKDMPDIDTSCFETFLKWFDFEYHGMIFDVSDDYLSIGDAKFDLYFSDAKPNWFIGSCGMLNEDEWNELVSKPMFCEFDAGFSNQWDIEKKLGIKHPE